MLNILNRAFRFIHKLEVSYASQRTLSKLIVTYYYQTTQY